MQCSSVISRMIESATIVLALMVSVCTAAPVDQPWQTPCKSASAASGANFVALMANLKGNAHDLQTSTTAFKVFLTEGTNPRVPASIVDLLDEMDVSVRNFPKDFKSNPQQNESAVLETDYIFLSKLYIFYKQTLKNTQACDDRMDKNVAEEKIRSIMSKTLLTLCTVDTYLDAKGHSMPADKIPTEDEVLGQTFPLMTNIPFRCHLNDLKNRLSVDYINSRDAEKTTTELRLQYIDLYDRLSSQGTSSG